MNPPASAPRAGDFRESEAESMEETQGDRPRELEAILRRFSAAWRRTLMLDYDGTLAPFRVERDRATPWPGVRERVAELARRGRTILVSGRSARDLPALLGFEPGDPGAPTIFGSHGWERWRPGDESPRLLLEESRRDALVEAARAAERFAPEGSLERKPAGVAIHWRGLPEDRADALRAEARRAWGDFFAPLAGFRVHPFDGGIELRPVGRNKGDAVREAIAGEPEDAPCAYLGDDRTDEDAFAEVARLRFPDGSPRGLGLLVREEPRPTLALARLRPPEELLDFLDEWLALEGRPMRPIAEGGVR